MNSVKRKCCVGEGDNAEKITFVAVKSDVKKGATLLMINHVDFWSA
jgi:hypothetical protein